MGWSDDAVLACTYAFMPLTNEGKTMPSYNYAELQKIASRLRAPYRDRDQKPHYVLHVRPSSGKLQWCVRRAHVRTTWCDSSRDAVTDAQKGLFMFNAITSLPIF